MQTDLQEEYIRRLAEFFTLKEYSEDIELRKVWRGVYQANRHIDFTTAARKANEAVIRHCLTIRQPYNNYN